jgi:hypothetical protein
MTLETQYLKIKHPTNFVKSFKDNSEFTEWCREGSINDLYCTLKAFKECELYEHCVIISNVIREKNGTKADI